MLPAVSVRRQQLGYKTCTTISSNCPCLVMCDTHSPVDLMFTPQCDEQHTKKKLFTNQLPYTDIFLFLHPYYHFNRV